MSLTGLNPLYTTLHRTILHKFSPPPSPPPYFHSLLHRRRPLFFFFFFFFFFFCFAAGCWSVVTHMREGTRRGNGESSFDATPSCGCIPAVPGLPSRYSPPLDRHILPEWRLLLLLPLGQASIPPWSFLGRHHRSRYRHRSITFQIWTSFHEFRTEAK